MRKRSGPRRRGAVASELPRVPWATRREPSLHYCYVVLEGVAWVWRLLGIFPFTIVGPMGMKKYKINKFYAVYGVLIFFTCAANWIYGMQHYKDFLRTEDVGRAFNSLVPRTMASMMCMAIASVIRVYRYKELPRLIDTMTTFEGILEKMGCPLSYGGKAKMLRASVSMSVTVTILLVAYDYSSSTQGFHSLRTTLRWLVWIVPLISQIQNLTIFVSLVGLLGLKFRALNDKIKTIVIRVNSSTPKVIVTSDVCGESLRLVAKTHFNVCAVGKRVNRFFKWDVIINVIAAVIILITTLFNIFIEVQRKNPTNYIRIGSYVHWEIFHSVPIIVIVVICNWTSQQCDYAGKLIHEIRVEKANPGLYDSVKSFSLQLHHQKLEFTAGGFFPLNSTLLQTSVANIATYLVILIQFQSRTSWD